MTRARTIANFGDGIATADIGDGQITTAKIASDAITDALLPAGSVLQVVTGTYDSSLNTGSTSFSDLIDLSITPASTSNKILLTISMYFAGRGSPRLLRNTTDTLVDPQVNYAFYHFVTDASLPYSSGTRTMQSFHLYDSPNSTSSVSYKLQIQAHQSGQNAVINPDTSNNFSTTGNGQSLTRMTLMEIAG